MTTVNLSTAGGSYNKVIDFNITFDDDGEVDKATFKINPTITAESGNDIRFYDDDDVLQFGGKLKDKNPLSGSETGLYELVCYAYDIELTEQTVNDVFKVIAFETLMSTIITSYSTMTFSTSLVTGITIDYYDANNKYARDVIKDLLTRSPDLTYYIDPATKIFYLITRGSTTSTISLTGGTNCIFETDWKCISDKQCTSLNLTGGSDANQGYVELFDGTGAQVTFTMENIFSNMKVSVGGVAKILQVTGQNTGDYTVSAKDKTITFLSAPAVGTENISCTYDYEIPIDLRGMLADPEYITQYGTITKTISRPHLKSTDDAIAYGYAYVNRWAIPVYGNKARIVSTMNANLVRPGYKIYVIDNDHLINGAYIADYYNIKSVTLNMDGLTIEVGDRRSDVIDFISEMKYEVKQLEQASPNATITTKVQTVSNNALITLGSEIVSITRRTWGTDTFYLDENGSALWNQMLDSGLGPIMRETGGYTDEPILTSYLATETLDLLTTESGDNLILE